MNTKLYFFASANTSRGFYCLFGKIFSPDELRRIYIIKGGPGSGKSVIMNKIADMAADKGYDTECFLCSSDINSLDGVIIPSLGVAVLDGTAPHTTDPLYPGAVEVLVDLVSFMDKTKLAEHKDYISGAIKSKSADFKNAYQYLAAAGNIDRSISDSISGAFLYDKAEKSIGRLLDNIKHNSKISDSVEQKITNRFISSISGSGFTHLDTLTKDSYVYSLRDKYNSSYIYMDILARCVKESGMSAILCPNPLVCESYDAIYLSDYKICFIACGEEEDEECHNKIINMERFIDDDYVKANKQKLRFAVKCREALMDGAYESLKGAYTKHSELEKLYTGSMDFAGINKLTEQLLSHIFE
ncbi:MAG: hypothetical protein AB9835_04320 [Eubacteriales bacterium]